MVLTALNHTNPVYFVNNIKYDICKNSIANFLTCLLLISSNFSGTPFRPGVHVGPGGSQGIYAGNFGNYGPLTFGLGRSAKNTKSVSEEDDKNE